MNYIDKLDLYNSNVKGALTKCISPFMLAHGSEEFFYGLLSGLIDGDGSVLQRFKVDHLSFEIRLYTSSKQLCKDIQTVCYKLGIRTSVRIQPPRGWSNTSYIVSLNSEDVESIIENINCYHNNKSISLNTWKLENKREYKNSHDVIPLSINEINELKDIAINTNNTYLFNAMNDKRCCCYYRRGLLSIIDHIENQLLKTRILNNNLYWYRLKCGKVSKNTVYDFEIPTTKVFIVNDGVVIYDTVSVDSVLADEANEEVNKYLNSAGRYIRSDGSLYLGDSDLQALMFYNLTRDPKSHLKKK